MPPQLGREAAREQKRPAQSRLQHPDFERQGIEIAKRYADVPARIVDQDIEPAEMTDHLAHAGVDRLRIPLVQL